MNIREFFGLCTHKWVEVDHGKLMRYGNYVGVYYTYQCTICKKLKEERSV